VFVIPPVALPSHDSFAQRYRTRFAPDSGEALYELVTASSMYPHMLANSGTLDAYENLTVPAGSVLIETDPLYRGETYLQAGRGHVDIDQWAMSRITVRVRPDTADALVVNQNFYRGWRAHRRDATGAIDTVEAHRSAEGLIAVAVGPEHREIELFYRSAGLVAGAWVSAASLGGCLIFLFLSGRASSTWPRMRRDSPPGHAR
jgi:hypothetical protein